MSWKNPYFVVSHLLLVWKASADSSTWDSIEEKIGTSGAQLPAHLPRPALPMLSAFRVSQNRMVGRNMEIRTDTHSPARTWAPGSGSVAGAGYLGRLTSDLRGPGGWVFQACQGLPLGWDQRG